MGCLGCRVDFFYFLLDTHLYLAYHWGMVTIVDEIDRVECIELRQQANYWRAQHARACQRQEVWKARALQLESTVRKCQATIDEQSQQIEALKARVIWLAQQVFGRKTESTIDSGNESQNLSDSSAELLESSQNLSQDKRKRGQQEGAKGHGRKLRLNLPALKCFMNWGRTIVVVQSVVNRSQSFPTPKIPSKSSGMSSFVVVLINVFVIFPPAIAMPYLVS